MITRNSSHTLLKQYVKNEALFHHCEMVAKAVEAYALHLGKPELEIEEWWTAGLLHDLDWEMFPDEHPFKAINDILPEYGYSNNILQAIKAHAPGRTGKEPESELDKYLFACDELSGFMHAVSLMRPTGFDGMKPKSVTKKMKTANFAANVSREDIHHGTMLINKPLNEHIQFLIDVFNA